ncbi:energy-coupling factor ABC transporter permease [Paludisphaera mucosa]|uniref:Energy-coupling factor ABC transporter permease n=1 Tax=Paludisphaera mucosa TaxID=3030827 RepID=A0ABT6FLT0_9BACT|nr:energy-coupling factor ABC transporter permease [Paludisphaera mucosa]MDG3008320.1 energy-coupling factor ABC transporter permease [Paludisphaera mucosa]
MHIPDALMDGRVAVATTVLGAAGLAYGLRAVERRHGIRTTSLMGMTAAFVFAAQMVNFPVGPGVSGHLLGGVLSAVLLGPWAGAVVIAAVLLVQCLLFQDGGLTALGANFVNMGLVGAVGGHAVYEPIRRMVGGRRGILVGSMVAAWFSVLLAAGAFTVELTAFGDRRDFLQVLSWMALVHAVIGLGEALITGLVVRFILLTRPEMMTDVEGVDSCQQPPPLRSPGWLSTAVAGLVAALGIAVFLAPFASEFPDGLEYVGGRLGFLPEGEAPPMLAAPMPDYQLPIPGVNHVKAATALAGVAGTLVVFALASLLARAFPRAET